MFTCLHLCTVIPEQQWEAAECRPPMANSWLIPPSVWFLDIWVWLLDHDHIFASLDCESRPAWPIADSYLHLFVSWTIECDCWIMLTCLEVWTVSPDQRWHSLTYTSICLISGHLSVIVRSCSHVWSFGLWVRPAMANSWLIPSSVCFLDILLWLWDHAHMFASLDCESRPAMANSWHIPPSVCFLDNWVWLLDHAHMFGGLNCESRPVLA